MAGKVTGAYLLAQPEKPLDVVCTGEAVVITVPTSPPDPIASVVVASVGGEVRPVQSSPAQTKDGTLRLTADDAEIHGATARVEGDQERNIGYWMHLFPLMKRYSSLAARRLLIICLRMS